MASTHKHLRSSTANKRPTTSIADGQIALNTNTASPGLFFKDSTGATIIKIGPVHVGTTAPNASPAAGGSTGNSTGEVWLDTSLTPNGVKIWNGNAWVNATPVGSTTVQGLLELATDAETQAGSDTARAVTPASLQSKMSDSATTTSATTIASSTAVKTAYDLANAALARSGGTITGNLEIGTTGSLSFEGSTADGFETTIAVTDPTADRTITLPDTTGTVVTTGDTGTVTSTMIADGTIVNADVNASAAIAGTKISPDFGAQNVTTTGTSTAASFIPTSSTVPTNGVYLPAANSVGISSNGTGRLFVNSSGVITNNASNTNASFNVVGTIAVGDSNASLYTPSHPINITTNAYNDTKLIRWMQRESSNARAYIGSIGNANFTADLVFGTNASTSDVAATEKVRITSAGLVGVGTSAPATNLDVVVGSGTATQKLGSSSVTGGSYLNLHGASASKTWFIGANYNFAGVLEFTQSTTNGGTTPSSTPAMVLSAAGNVGIGTTSPGVKVDIVSDNNTSQTSVLRVNSNNVAVNTALAYDGVTCNSLMYVGTTSANPLVFNINTTERARIDSSGRLGIGTSAPGTTLEISSGAGSSPNLNGTSGNLAITQPGLLTSLQIGGYGTAPYALWMQGQNKSGSTFPIVLNPAGGNVGIGTTSPGSTLHLYGAPAELRVESSTASDGYIRFINTSGSMSVGMSGAAGNTFLLADRTNNHVAYQYTGGASGYHLWAINNAERARIDSSGRLLVGTSSSSAGTRATFQGNSSNTSGEGVVRINRGAATPAINDTTGVIVFGDSADGEGAYIFGARDGGTWSGSSKPSRLVFSTTADGASSPTERMRITSSGKLLVGTTDASAAAIAYFRTGVDADTFHIWNDGASLTSNVLLLSASRNTTNSTYNFLSCVRQGTAFSLIIRDSGNVQNANNSYGALSDVKLKENIVGASSQWNDIKSLQVRKYNFKEETGQSTHTQIGLIAQEVELVSPGLVSESPDRDAEGNDLGTVTKSVNYSVLYMKAVKALQEAMERIETLEAKVTALEGA